MRSILGTTQPWEPTPEQYGEWTTRNIDLDAWWQWLSGEALDVLNRNGKLSKDNSYPLMYPLKINPIKPAAMLHNYALWGEVPDTSDPMVKTVLEKKEGLNTDLVDKTLAQVFYENHMRDLDMDMGLQSQFLGGVVYKVTWDPDDGDLPLGVRIEYIDVREFWCEWSGSNHWSLTKAWIKRDISAEEAKTYGVDIGKGTGIYLESWTRSERHITINGKDALHPKTQRPLSEPHDLGFVPFIYIWGISLVPDMIGLAEELNSRKADQGDALRKGVHRKPWGRNIPNGHPTIETLSDGQEWINAGKSIGQQPEPQMDTLDAPDIPESSQKFTENLLDLLRIAGFTPSIAYGEEEGSQRSGQTLYSRMWPTLAHVRHERGWWTEGKNQLAEYVLRILAARKMGDIVQAHLGQRKRQIWSPMVPVDRAALVDELVQRMSSDMTWPEHALGLLGDVVDIPAAVEAIKAWKKFEAEMEAAAQPAFPNAGVQPKPKGQGEQT